MNIKELVDRIVADGKLTKEEHLEFQSAIMADGKLDKEEKEQLKRILDMIEQGKLTIE